MSLVAAIRDMLAKGLSLEQALATAELIEDREEARLARKKAKAAAEAEKEKVRKRDMNAARQARYRERHPDLVAQRNAARRRETNVIVTRVTPLKQKEPSPPTPPLLEKLNSLPDSAKAESSPRAAKQNDFNELLDWFEAQWNGMAAACGLPKIQAMTDTRISHIRRRADDLVKALRFPDPQSGFTETFNRIRGSPWLRGANGRAWKADVDWMLTESNFLQIHEGKYARDQRPEHNRR